MSNSSEISRALGIPWYLAREVWDALLYRTAVVRAELKPMDLAVTVSAMARHRCKTERIAPCLVEQQGLQQEKEMFFRTSWRENVSTTATLADSVADLEQSKKFQQVSRARSACRAAYTRSRSGGHGSTVAAFPKDTSSRASLRSVLA
eukprot:3778100-Amphidinium_carterae.1